MRSKRRLVLMGLVGLALAFVVYSPGLLASPGGVLSGTPSGTEEYNCGGSCHTVPGSTALTMWASSSIPLIDTEVTVLVNASGGEAVNDGIIGIMLVSSLVEDATSVPSNAGWTIVGDPSLSGTTGNYFENYTYNGTRSFQWKLKTPSVPGQYHLYARAMHGGGAKYYEDDATGLTFDVDVPVVIGSPLVLITTVNSNEVLKDTVKVNVTVVSDTAVERVELKLNDTIIGNATSEPYTFTLDTTKYTDGYYLLNVTAIDSEGMKGYRQIPVSIDNAAAPATKQLVSWIWTLAAGSIAILAWIGILIVIALMIRRRTVSKGGK